MTKIKLKRCGAEKHTSCPCRRLHIGGQQEGRDPLAGIPVAQPWTRNALEQGGAMVDTDTT
jgi:hypothetical protein